MSNLTAIVAASGALRFGSKGDGVRALQAALSDAGYRVTADGDFGPATDAAVRQFQKKKGMVADGIAGAKTAAALAVGVAKPSEHAATSCPDGAPAWLKAAWKEIGTREEPENKGPAIRRYIAMAHAGQEGDAWCSIFADAMLESVGIHGTRSASSQSFRHDGGFVKLSGPALGAIVVFWRTSLQSGLGHVAFYCGERDGHVWTLGGNQNDEVCIEPLPEHSPKMGIVGYYWPRGETMPSPKPIAWPDTALNKITTVT